MLGFKGLIAYIIKILETWVGFKDLCCSVVFSEHVAVYQISPALEFQVQKLNNSLLVGFPFFVQQLQHPVVSGLGFSAIVPTNHCWRTPLSNGLWLGVSTIID